MKKVFALLLALSITLGLTACTTPATGGSGTPAPSSAPSGTSTPAPGGSKGVIYGIYKAGDQTWFIDEGAAAEQAAKDAGYDFIYVDAKMSPEEYLKAIDNAIANKAAGVVTCIPDQTMSQAAVDKLKEAKKKDEHLDEKIRDFMCSNFYDIRTFGAVMTTFVKASLNCGQVRGPVQLGFARSVDPIMPQEVTITRVAITTEEDAAKKGTEMGRKFIVPYGLYRAEGFVSANLARKTTGFDEDDLALLWKAILNMFENDRSAARGMMAVRKLIIFKHDSELGNAPAWKLFKLVDVQRKPEIAAPRSFEDYQFSVDTEHLPQGVTCQIME